LSRGHFHGMRATAIAITAAAVLLGACSASAGIPKGPELRSQLQVAATPRPSVAQCEPGQVALAVARWGAGGGATHAVLHAVSDSQRQCALPLAPGVQLVDASGVALASTPGTDGGDGLLEPGLDYDLAFASWCGAPLSRRRLVVRLVFPTGTMSTDLPPGFGAGCQNTAPSLVISPLDRAPSAP
jgi:hypothetical protein